MPLTAYEQALADSAPDTVDAVERVFLAWASERNLGPVSRNSQGLRLPFRVIQA
jgi:hypothetical protein